MGVFFFLLLVFGTIGLVLYFVPTLVAVVRGAPDRGVVFAVNAFLGWTVLGWVAAMAMALMGTGSSRRVPPARTPVDSDGPIYETRVLEAAAAELPDDPFANL